MNKTYTTTIHAEDPITGEMFHWNGPIVPGYSFDDAQMYCQVNGLGYCKVDGEYTGEQQFIDNLN